MWPIGFGTAALQHTNSFDPKAYGRQDHPEGLARSFHITNTRTCRYPSRIVYTGNLPSLSVQVNFIYDMLNT